MGTEKIIVTKIVSGGTFAGNIPDVTYLVSAARRPADTTGYTPTVVVNGITLSGKQVSFDYIASVNYKDVNGVERTAVTTGSVTTTDIADMCSGITVKTGIVEKIEASVSSAVYNATTFEIEFIIPYIIYYNKCNESVITVLTADE